MMLSKLKLIHQAILLVAVPLLFELGFVGLLWTMNSDLENSLKIEGQAKRTVSVLTYMMEQVVDLQATMVQSTLRRDEAIDAKYTRLAAKIQGQLRELNDLVKGDPITSKIIAKLEKHTNRLILLAPKLKDAFGDSLGDYHFVEFFHDSDFWTEAIFNAKSNRDCIEKLLDHYEKTIDSVRPEAARRREQIKQTIIAMVVFNILIAVAMAVYFSKTTVRRLTGLMNNIDRFGSGGELLEPIKGEDEIAELDKEFRQMAVARQRAEQVRRDMVAMVSHDLRTPLSATNGYVTLLLEGVYGELPEKQYTVLSNMESELHRLIRLANDLLDVEKIESGSLDLNVTEQSAGEMIADSTNAIRGIADIKRVKIVVQSPEHMVLHCDGDRITQVLINLLSNAIKFTSPDTQVTIRATSESDDSRFEVQDQGPGIPAQSIAYVFDRFKQLDQDADSKRTGSGLGLTICKAIVEEHGGAIGVESTLNEGACFWFTIPKATGKA